VHRTARAVLTTLMAAVVTALSLPTATPAEAASVIRIVKIQYDSPGTDTGTNLSLNSEYVVVKNTSTTTRVLTGWTLRDLNGFVYTFPSTHLGAGASITVHTGQGTVDPRNRYWQRSWYVWNNTGDTAILRNATGWAVHQCGWTATGTGSRTC
jgi:Lamin Tail Domain